ncbi:glycosyltransferase [Mucilaginibacter robiniae]|uniref:Glycosyltransferase n=1 Tax=Mucilaginibacter robiniae TaxID=2728022 RepID=A0A7L5E3G0_9SPHI|nr:glycosyltransferase [Mucilaginibacter robiniae]QJD96947.1 glycosyltransferase [Mucilaginibacter robiniae]
MLQLSVIICTHNPRLEYLNRVFEALRKQTLALQQWELLLVDNGSKQQLTEVFDLSWHPSSRIVREDKLGLTPARIRGIEEAKAELLIFVDDDNLLKSNYLEVIAKQFQENKLIGILGAGKIIPEFEVQPSAEVMVHTNMLALRNESRAYYSNELKFSSAIPYGAGTAIRRNLALKYVEACRNHPMAAALGRTGNALLSGEDVDMALQVCQSGYLSAVLPELELIHIIPQSRLETDYLLRIAAGHAYSHYLLGKMWGYNKDYKQNAILKRLRYLSKLKRMQGLAKKIYIAEYKAVEDARLAWSKAVN